MSRTPDRRAQGYARKGSEMPETFKGYVLPPGAGIDDDQSLKANGASTGGAITLIESVTDGGAPLHVHEHDDECFYVIDGIISVRIDNETYEAPKGAFVFLPKRIPHAWDVVGGPEMTATVLLITVPAGLDAFLHRFHKASSQEERDAISRDHGITFLPEREQEISSQRESR